MERGFFLSAMAAIGLLWLGHKMLRIILLIGAFLSFNTFTHAQTPICNGIADDRAAITAALAANTIVVLPAGTCLIASTVTIPSGKSLIGSGIGTTTLLASGPGINMVIMSDRSILKDMTIDGSIVNDVVGATGVFFQDADYAVVENVHIKRQGFHGIAYVRSTYNRVVNVSVDAAGHRCMNMSESSTFNIVSGFTGTDCRRAGIIVGFLSNDNLFTDIDVSGHVQAVGGAGLWVHMNSSRNVFNNVVIGPAAAGATTTPSIILNGGSQSNIFNNIKINSGLTRAIYIWNLDVSNPELGTANADILGNLFTNVVINGISAFNSSAIMFNDQTISPNYTIKDNSFVNIKINGFTSAVSDCYITSPAQCPRTRALQGVNMFQNLSFNGWAQ